MANSAAAGNPLDDRGGPRIGDLLATYQGRYEITGVAEGYMVRRKHHGRARGPRMHARDTVELAEMLAADAQESRP
jgi:hypothetical protein